MVRRISKQIFKKTNEGVTSLVILFLLSFSTSFAQKVNYTLSKNAAIEGNAFKKEKHNLNGLTVYDLAYKSFDGTNIKGFLIAPHPTGKKFPVIIYNRGGNGSYGMVTEPLLVRFLCKIAARGYVVIGSQLRGSEGSDGVDEWGGKDIDDVMALFSVIDDLDYTDKEKVAQIGWSRGGVTNFQLLKRTDRIKTSVSMASPSDLLKTKRPIMFTVYKNRIRNYEKDSVFYTNRVSPFFQIDSIKNKKTSILYLHGNKDTTVELSNSQELYDKTLKKGINTKFIIFPDADHSFRENFSEVVDTIDDWLKTEMDINE